MSRHLHTSFVHREVARLSFAGEALSQPAGLLIVEQAGDVGVYFPGEIKSVELPLGS
jgi:hypothetical protein